MTHKVDMVMDFQYGSTGKGLIAGYLAKRGDYDTSVCSFATNAGHTYIDKERGLHLMTQQLPTGGLVSSTVKNILIGPGALIHEATLLNELDSCAGLLQGKRIMIHPQAAVVTDEHARQEVAWGMTKMGSTAKGVGAAMIERIKRDPVDPNTAGNRFLFDRLHKYLVSEQEYRAILDASESVLVEGAQGFSLSLYHGQYPYVTSRDVTPWQIAADCALPFKWAPYIKVIGTMRTYPIRVNNRDGSSGPCYPDQREVQWEELADRGVIPELTTVTKLKRRIFTFSQQQAAEAAFHCGGYWETKIFLNFANYCNGQELADILADVETPQKGYINPPKITWIGWGADDSDVMPR